MAHQEKKKVGAADQQPAEKKKGGGSNKKSAKKPKIHYDQFIFRDWCKMCGICSAFCPKGVIGQDEIGMPVIERPDDCIGCRFCELHCPDFAITIKERKSES
jgi:2-oxoglutarate ferredoxin oxidoreductase subunit delta